MAPEKKDFALPLCSTFLLLGLLLTACESKFEKVVIGRQAPNFTYLDLNGSTRELKDLKGKVVLLRFWADWCAICTAEMPIIDKVYQDMKNNGFTVLAVNVKQAETTVKTYVKKLNLSYSIALDQKGKITEKYNVRGVPWNFLINKEGILKDIFTGGISEQMLREFLEPYIS
jgi:peroxiredoxin